MAVPVEVPREWTLHLPYLEPPLSANHRPGHWSVRHRLTKRVVEDTMWLVRSVRVPALAACSVQLHYRPTSNRRRDTDNLVPTLKPICDALVRAGVVVEDTPRFVRRPEPVIHRWAKAAYPPRVLWVVLTECEQRGEPQ